MGQYEGWGVLTGPKKRMNQFESENDQDQAGKIDEELIFEGYFLDGKRHGQGVQIHDDGSKYEGEFKDDRPHGAGVETTSNGIRFQSQFINGIPHGFVVVNFPEGYACEGQMDHGKEVGKWLCIEPNGAKYEGETKKLKYNGWGVLTVPDQFRYESYFRDGLRHGRCKKTELTGSFFECIAKDDYPFGEYIYLDENGGLCLEVQGADGVVLSLN